MEEDTTKSHYTIPEVALMLRISRIAVYKKVKAGKIRASRLGRTFMIPKEELESLLGGELKPAEKAIIEQAVKKTMKDYGDVLKRLGTE